MKRFLAVSALFLSLCSGAYADGPAPRAITVSGESHEQLVPDQAILSMSLTNRDKVLHVAKTKNDDMVKQLIEIAQKFNIPKEKISTSRIYIAPEYATENNAQKFMGYVVSRSLQITMDSMDVHEKLLSAIIDAKLDRVDGVEFRLANPESHSAEIRLKAFENAKSKATALAQAAGAKLGAVVNISTVGARTPLGAPVMSVMRSVEDASSVPSLPGMIDVHETVTVTFALD